MELPRLLLGSDGVKWIWSTANEFGRLTKGVQPHMPTGSQTMWYIYHHELPKGLKATYSRFFASERPHKVDSKRVRLTVGRNQIDYPGRVSTPTAGITTAKLLFNSVISTPNARLAVFDLKDFDLGTPMERYKYMHIPLSAIPQSIIEQYTLLKYVHNGHVLVEISKGMYGLPQTGILAYEQLVRHLQSSGYSPCNHTAGIWRRHTRPITRCLVVDDFAVKYVDEADTNHLLQALESRYTVTTDWDAKMYCALSQAWDYAKRTVEISMPGYVEKALQRFCHIPTTRIQNSSHAWIPPHYGAHQQMTPPPDDSNKLDRAGITRLQEVIGVFLFYGRAVDCTMLVSLCTLASQQADGTQATAKAVTQLLNYAAAHPDATIRYVASNMYLNIHSDASYLSEAKVRSRIEGTFFISDRPKYASATPSPTATPPQHNGAIHIISSIVRNVMASATEAELVALFHNACDGIPLRTALIEMGHP
jgi:hypothetical protein